MEEQTTHGTVDGLLRLAAAREPGKNFVRCGGEWLTFREVDLAAQRVADALAANGVAKGDRLAIIATNRQEFIEFIFGCARLGAIQVPLNPYLRGEYLRYQLADSGATLLVADNAGWLNASAIVADTEVRTVVLLDTGAQPPSPAGKVVVSSFRDFCAAGKLGREHAAAHPEDLVSILYTSGTTGMPKGCMMPNSYYAHIPTIWRDAGWIRADDTQFSAGPLFHAAAQLLVVMPALLTLSSVHLETSFEASKFMRRARQTGATVVRGVGAMATAILAQPPSPEDAEHSFRLASWIPLQLDRQLEFEKRFKVRVVSQTFGQTECATAAILPLSEEGNRRSFGKASPNYEIRVVDDMDNEVPRGTTGEMVIRPQMPGTMFSGYWNKPEATVAAFRNLWHHSGDLVVMDQTGFLTFVDRKKDALRRRGENVSAFELEATIQQHPAVSTAAVCALPSEMGEDEIKACLLLREGASLELKDLFQFLLPRIPYFAMPRYVQIRSSLPLTATGKVQKHLLREEGLAQDVVDLQKLGLVVSREDRRALG